MIADRTAVIFTRRRSMLTFGRSMRSADSGLPARCRQPRRGVGALSPAIGELPVARAGSRR